MHSMQCAYSCINNRFGFFVTKGLRAVHAVQKKCRMTVQESEYSKMEVLLRFGGYWRHCNPKGKPKQHYTFHVARGT